MTAVPDLAALLVAHRTPLERFAAAVTLFGSDQVDRVRVAEALALRVMAQVPRARPLAAAAFDRLRVFAGQPQKFGTWSELRDGRRELGPVDPSTTDSERAKWGLPPLRVLRESGLSPPPWA